VRDPRTAARCNDRDGETEIAERIPPNVRNRHVHFVRCIGCDQVYWRGSHVERILAELSDVIAA
jgi:uncharacterized protein with PIN domain